MAIYTDADIATMALGHIDIGQEVEDLAGSKHLERVCGRSFAHARDEVLARKVWPFTTQQLELGLVEAFDPGEGDWLFSYRYPVTCISLRRIVSPVGLPQAEAIPYKLGQDDTGRLIFCDEASAKAECTTTYDDPGEWPSLYAKAVSWCLATYICGPLGKGAKRGDCMAGYEDAITNAAGVAARENANQPRPPSSYVSAR